MPGHELVGREAVHDARGPGEEPEEVRTDADLVDRGPDRLAGVRALEPTEHVGLGLEGVGDLEQQERAVLRRRLLVRLEGRRGGLDGAVHVLGRARRDVGDDLVIGRVDDVGRLAVRGVDELAADELLVGLDALERVGHGTASWA